LRISREPSKKAYESREEAAKRGNMRWISEYTWINRETEEGVKNEKTKTKGTQQGASPTRRVKLWLKARN